jgi:hypothetical protein
VTRDSCCVSANDSRTANKWSKYVGEGSSIITPSQQRVPEGEKIRKEKEREREEKFDKYNRPQGERRVKEREEERMERELKFDENSRPKGQKKVLND